MSDRGALILFLPDDDASGLRWARSDGETIVARGDDMEFVPDIGGDRIAAVPPADAVTLHWAELPDLATAQARAAARLMVSENSLSPANSLHVALGRRVDGEPDQAIGAVATDRIAGWIATLQALGLDPDAIVPAPMLLPRPDEGYVAGEIAQRTVLRGRNGGFADEPELSPHIVADAACETLVDDRLDRSIAAEIAAPALNLRQGAFAKRQRWRIDWPLVRRLVWLSIAIAAVTLLIGLVLIARYGFAADRLEMRAETAARQALPRAASAGNPVAELDARLLDIRGGGLGFSTTAGIVFGAIQATPNVELVSLDFGADGLLRATVAAPGAPEADAVRLRIVDFGLRVEASPFQADAGRITGEFRISGR